MSRHGKTDGLSGLPVLACLTEYFPFHFETINETASTSHQIGFVTWRFNVVGDSTWAMRGRCKRDIFTDLEMCDRCSWVNHPQFPADCHKLIEWSMAPYCNFLMSLSEVTLKTPPCQVQNKAIQNGPRSQDSSGVHRCRYGSFRENHCSAGPNVHTIRRRLDITSTRDASWFVKYVAFHCPVAVFNAMWLLGSWHAEVLVSWNNQGTWAWRVPSQPWP